MNRKNRAGMTFLLFFTFLWLAGNVPAAGQNVLLYVVDDQGSTDAGCYGNPAIKTPGLDALAAAGTRFTHAFCTTASCSASRSVILSGQHNHANGQYGHQHSYHHFSSFPGVKSMPVLLAELKEKIKAFQKRTKDPWILKWEYE